MDCTVRCPHPKMPPTPQPYPKVCCDLLSLSVLTLSHLGKKRALHLHTRARQKERLAVESGCWLLGSSERTHLSSGGFTASETGPLAWGL